MGKSISTSEKYVPVVCIWKFWACSTGNYISLLSPVAIHYAYGKFDHHHAKYGKFKKYSFVNS
jgi:hypothetical protein